MKPLECSRLNAKNGVQAGEENLVVNSVKSSRKIQQKNRNVVIVRVERISFTIHSKTVSVLYPAR